MSASALEPGPSVHQAGAPARPPRPALVRTGPLAFLVRAFGVLWSNWRARVGLVIIGVFLLVALLAPELAPYSPYDSSFPDSLPPSAAHLLGTTGTGQDLLSQLVYGARVSLLVAFSAGVFATLIAAAVGLVSGYLSGVVDEVLVFATNLMLVIPGLPLMIVLATYLPGKGITVIIFVIVITGWAWGARVLRSQTVSLRNRDFVLAAQFAGDRVLRIVFREILPNMTSLIAASFFIAATTGVLAEAGLEFLGLGNPATVSWGTMLYWAQNTSALLTGQWIQVFAPGLCIGVLAASLSLVNFGVDALSNPRLREH
ncbi:MAG: ABC transporter permease [Actinomycetes bacterium]